MRLRVKRLSEGPGPGEVVIEVATEEGTEQVVVHLGAIEEGDIIEVGYPILHSNDKSRSLIELPREAASGRWRVWVPSSSFA